MGSKKDEILSNPLVTGTMDALEKAGFPLPDLASNPEIEEFANMDALIPVMVAIGAVSEAEEKTGRRLDRAKLPKEVGEAMVFADNIRDSGITPFEALPAVLALEKPWAPLLGVLTFLDGTEIINDSGLKGPAYEAEISNAALLVMDSLIQNGSWKSVPPQIMDGFFFVVTFIEDSVTSEDLKLRLGNTISALATQIAKGAGDEMTAPPPPKPAAPQKGKSFDL